MYDVHGGVHGASEAPPSDAPAPGRKVGALGRARRAMLPDERLAKQAAAGDLGAFEAIFQRYQDDLYRFCVGILREPQDAQDAVQNTMVKAMRALPGERREMQLKPWLYRIAHNEAVELRRRARPAEEPAEAVEDLAAGTEERVEHNGRLRTLLADIADLPERQRASLVMRELNGLGFGEIGAVLGTSPGAVRQALYEARRGLTEMDHGRDMRCDVAVRMVSDADGRPRDRGVRAHLRDCSPCRRFQAEIRGRTRTLAAISPMPVIAAGALKAALGGSGAAAAAGGAGAGAGAAGVGVATGSLGASALLKPAVGLLAALAIGTTAVEHGGGFHPDRHDVASAAAKVAPAVAAVADSTAAPVVAVHRGSRVGAPAIRVAVPRRRGGEALGAADLAARRGAGLGARTGAVAVTSGDEARTAGGAPREEKPGAVVAAPAVGPVGTARPGATGVTAPGVDGSAAGSGAAQPQAPESPSFSGRTNGEGAEPGQAEEEAEGAEPATTEGPAPTADEAPDAAPPDQSEPGSDAEAAPGESPTAAAVTTDVAEASPGQVKTEEAAPAAPEPR